MVKKNIRVWRIGDEPFDHPNAKYYDFSDLSKAMAKMKELNKHKGQVWVWSDLNYKD
jgi:hypothetical protein